jgi:hypothetical protein
VNFVEIQNYEEIKNHRKFFYNFDDFYVVAYADDIAIKCSSEREINLAVDAIERWTNKNKLILNKKKIHYCIFLIQK